MSTTQYVQYPFNQASNGSSGSASVAIGSAASSKAVTFTTDYGSTNYVVLTSITNVTDATPIFLQVVVTAKSSSGFTATFNAPTDTANYVLEYMIVGYV